LGFVFPTQSLNDNIANTMKKKIAIGSLGILVLLSLIVTANLWFAPGFQGGELSKGSLFSYPRFHGRLPMLDLGKTGRYSATFHGFPVHDAWIELELVDKTYKDLDPANSLNSIVSLRIEGDKGRVVCSASSSLKQIGSAEHHWVLTGNADFARLWNSDCMDLNLGVHETYTVSLTVEAADTQNTLYAHPILLGGGIELP
jgi:hypothetical protein